MRIVRPHFPYIWLNSKLLIINIVGSQCFKENTMVKFFFSKSKFWDMRIFLMFLLLTVSSQILYAYNLHVRNSFDKVESQTSSSEKVLKDDRIVVSLIEADGVDARCDVFSKLHLSNSDSNEIEELIRNGRYIKSITPTKFGILVVSVPNVENIPQMCTTIPAYALKKEVDKKFKEGWSLSYYNNIRDYAIFDRNPAITQQIYTQFKIWKKDAKDKIAKWNAKGFYLTAVIFGNVILQNGHGNNIEQSAASLTCYKRDDEFIKGIQKHKDDGWVVSSSVKFYNDHGDYDSYYTIFDKANNESKQEQKIILLGTNNGIDEFRTHLDSKYKIDRIWGGWKYVDYAAQRAAAAAYKPDWMGIVNGIVTGVSELAGGNSSSNMTSASAGVMENVNSEATGDTSRKKTSNTSAKGNASNANHANWHSLEKSYSGYESTLIRMSNSSDIDKQEVRRIQKKMREIREKIRIQSGGHQRAVSQWENWNP